MYLASSIIVAVNNIEFLKFWTVKYTKKRLIQAPFERQITSKTVNQVYINRILFAVSPKTCWFKRMSLSKDTIITLGLIGGSLAVFPFLDDQTKFFLELLMIGGQFGIQVLNSHQCVNKNRSFFSNKKWNSKIWIYFTYEEMHT